MAVLGETPSHPSASMASATFAVALGVNGMAITSLLPAPSLPTYQPEVAQLLSYVWPGPKLLYSTPALAVAAQSRIANKDAKVMRVAFRIMVFSYLRCEGLVKLLLNF